MSVFERACQRTAVEGGRDRNGVLTRVFPSGSIILCKELMKISSFESGEDYLTLEKFSGCFRRKFVNSNLHAFARVDVNNMFFSWYFKVTFFATNGPWVTRGSVHFSERWFRDVKKWNAYTVFTFYYAQTIRLFTRLKLYAVMKDYQETGVSNECTFVRVQNARSRIESNGEQLNSPQCSETHRFAEYYWELTTSQYIVPLTTGGHPECAINSV